MEAIPPTKDQTHDNVALLRAAEAKEPITRFLKTRLVELKPGYAKVTIRLSPEHQNFNGLVFGGIIMSVADQAFAYATNSLIKPSLAAQFNIHFLSAPGGEDELVAECWVVKSGRRVGISEIKVSNQEGKIIAKATGTTIPRPSQPGEN